MSPSVSLLSTLISSPLICILKSELFWDERTHIYHGKNGFVTAAKLGTTDKILVAATKNFAAATKRFVDN